MQKLVNSRNTKRSLPWEVKAEILSEFSNSMSRSGYSEEFRLDVIRCEMWCGVRSGGFLLRTISTLGVSK